MFFLIKTVEETVQNVGIDFSGRLLTGEVISSHTVTCATSGIVVGDEHNDTQIYCDLTAGVDKTEYIITYKATGNLGSILESSVMLCIKEN